MKKIYFLASLLFANCASRAQLCFGPPTNYSVQSDSYGICKGDFNGDGLLDLAATNNTNGSVSVFFGSGSGSFTLMQNVPCGSNPQGIVAKDFTGDGKPDLAVANNGSNNVSILANNGFGSFSQFYMGIAGNGPKRITAGDFNGDGFADVAVGNASSASVSVLLNNGTGGFPTSTQFFTPSQPWGICNGDFNNDAILDIVVVNNASDDASVLLGMGNGNFMTATNYTICGVSGGNYSVVAHDFNSDGNLDLIVSNNSANIVVTMQGDGAGGFGTRFSIPANSTPRGLALGDFNMDGKKDLVTTLFGNNEVMALMGNGGTFVGPTNFSTGNGPRDVVAGDFNGDGKDDIATSNLNSSNISVMLNTLPSTTISGTDSICVGAAATFTASGASTYTWTGGANTTTISVTPTVTTTYTLLGSNSNCGVSVMDTIRLKVNQLPVLTATASPASVCAGKSLTLTAGGAQTYTWSNGVINGVPFSSPPSTTVYTLTGSSIGGCTNSTTFTVNASTPTSPNICMLTADSLALNNIIYWDKTLYPTADSFMVYRYDAFSSNYLLLGAVPKDSGSFTDTQRNIGGPNGGDPQYGSWQYKLAIKDTCGNTSAKSPYHQSVFVQDQHNTNFNWNAYVIEVGQPNPVTGYSFLRDDNNTGAWHVLVNTGGTSTTDPNYSSYPNGNWRVDALGFNCSANLRTINGAQGTVVKSKSNISNNRTTSVRFPLRELMSLYPNPNNGYTTLAFKQPMTGKLLLHIYSSMGTEIYSKTLLNPSGEIMIDLSTMENGIYFLKVTTETKTVVFPVTKN